MKYVGYSMPEILEPTKKSSMMWGRGRGGDRGSNRNQLRLLLRMYGLLLWLYGLLLWL